MTLTILRQQSCLEIPIATILEPPNEAICHDTMSVRLLLVRTSTCHIPIGTPGRSKFSSYTYNPPLFVYLMKHIMEVEEVQNSTGGKEIEKAIDGFRYVPRRALKSPNYYSWISFGGTFYLKLARSPGPSMIERLLDATISRLLTQTSSNCKNGSLPSFHYLTVSTS